MSLDDIIQAGGFFASFAGLLIALISLRQGTKLVAIAVLVSIGVASTGVSLYRAQQRYQEIAKIKNEIVESLAYEPLTFDELHSQLLFRTFPDATQALFELIDNDTVQHCLSQALADERTTAYRLYYIDTPPRLDTNQSSVAVEVQDHRPRAIFCNSPRMEPFGPAEIGKRGTGSVHNAGDE